MKEKPLFFFVSIDRKKGEKSPVFLRFLVSNVFDLLDRAPDQGQGENVVFVVVEAVVGSAKGKALKKERD